MFDGQSTTLRSSLFTFTNRNLRFSCSLFFYFWIVSALAVDSCRLARDVSLYLVKKTERKPWFLERATVAGWDFGEEWAASSSWEGFRGEGWTRKEHVRAYSRCVGEEMPKSAYTTIIFSSPSKWNFHAALSTPQALIRDSALLHPSQRAFPCYFKK